MHPAHDLMPREIQDKLPGLEETAMLRSSEMPVIVKYFHPATSFTWYIGAGEPLEPGIYCQPDGKGGVEEFEVKEGEDWKLFGLLDMGFPELGYVHLSQLQKCHEGQRGFKSLPVERDLHFPDGITLQDVIDGKAV